MQYFFETYGCQMNKAESAAMETMFSERYWQAAQSAETADMVIINTCSVRITAENRAWGRISHFAAQKKQRDFVLVVTGCMAERLKQEMKQQQPAIDYVLGNFQKQAFGLLIDAAANNQVIPDIEESPQFVFAASHEEKGSFKAFVPIMHGCDNFCAYCIVPYVRGREVSRNPLAILAEIRKLADHGVREVSLLGQNVNSYNWTQGVVPVDGFEASLPDNAEAIKQLRQRMKGMVLDFPALLSWLAAILASSMIGRIRFMSSHPKDLSAETIEVLASSEIFARHLHLCVQHGSDPVLRAMNRKYTVQTYRELVSAIRKKIPDISLSTDILVGFPGETEADVEATLELIKEIGFAYAYMYYFNPREGTPAATMDNQVATTLKKERLARVISLQKEVTKGIMASFIGKVFSVLVEGPSKKNSSELLGRTDQDMMVVFKGSSDLIGSFVRVRLDSLRGNTFKATLLT